MVDARSSSVDICALVGGGGRVVGGQTGKPRSTMVVGTQETGDCGSGQVVLVAGAVDRVVREIGASGRALSPGPAPKSQTGTPPAAAEPATFAAGHPAWLTDMGLAKSRKKQAKKRLLVLFAGSDWCPPG